tara:strand:+ start:380 stop:1246 length:867 start_codon:yes stop_codon:yes gene_type:complete
MRQAPIIHVRGIEASIGQAFVERILRTNAHLVIGSKHFEEISKQFSTELEYSEGELHSSDELPMGEGHRLLLIGLGPFGEEADGEMDLEVDGLEVALMTPASSELEVDSEWLDSHIIVHDVLTSNPDSTWSSDLFQNWMEQLHAKNIPSPSSDALHWWVSEVDVVDALVRILLSDEPFPSELKVSGRRAWNQSQTLEELSLLYSRTMAGRTGDFGIEHLTAAPTPTIEVRTLNASSTTPMSVEQNAQIRPDLSPLHDLLHRIDGDGWRPLVPIRTALMHSLAGYIQRN